MNLESIKKSRRKTLGITLLKGAKIYDYRTEKEFLLENELYVPDIGVIEQLGHIRFNAKIGNDIKRERYALAYENNRFKYEWKMSEG